MIAVVKSVSELTNLTSRAGKELTKREISLVDDSNTSVMLTLWGEQAGEFEAEGREGHVLAIKGARVGDFGGVNLGALFSSRLTLDPDLDRANDLAGWWQLNAATEVRSLSTRGGGGAPKAPITVGQAENWGFGTRTNPDGCLSWLSNWLLTGLRSLMQGSRTTLTAGCSC